MRKLIVTTFLDGVVQPERTDGDVDDLMGESHPARVA